MKLTGIVLAANGEFDAQYVDYEMMGEGFDLSRRDTVQKPEESNEVLLGKPIMQKELSEESSITTNQMKDPLMTVMKINQEITNEE